MKSLLDIRVFIEYLSKEFEKVSILLEWAIANSRFLKTQIQSQKL